MSGDKVTMSAHLFSPTAVSEVLRIGNQVRVSFDADPDGEPVRLSVQADGTVLFNGARLSPREAAEMSRLFAVVVLVANEKLGAVVSEDTTSIRTDIEIDDEVVKTVLRKHRKVGLGFAPTGDGNEALSIGVLRSGRIGFEVKQPITFLTGVEARALSKLFELAADVSDETKPPAKA